MPSNVHTVLRVYGQALVEHVNKCDRKSTMPHKVCRRCSASLMGHGYLAGLKGHGRPAAGRKGHGKSMIHHNVSGRYMASLRGHAWVVGLAVTEDAWQASMGHGRRSASNVMEAARQASRVTEGSRKVFGKPHGPRKASGRLRQASDHGRFGMPLG